jgi:hypothetical protein
VVLEATGNAMAVVRGVPQEGHTWMGGWPPLGYEVEDRRPVVVEREAALVRRIFDRFANTGSALTITVLLADFAAVWNELFPRRAGADRAVLVERVDVKEHAIEVRIRAEGIASLIGELRDERKAA